MSTGSRTHEEADDLDDEDLAVFKRLADHYEEDTVIGAVSRMMLQSSDNREMTE